MGGGYGLLCGAASDRREMDSVFLSCAVIYFRDFRRKHDAWTIASAPSFTWARSLPSPITVRYHRGWRRPWRCHKSRPTNWRWDAAVRIEHETFKKYQQIHDADTISDYCFHSYHRLMKHFAIIMALKKLRDWFIESIDWLTGWLFNCLNRIEIREKNL